MKFTWYHKEMPSLCWKDTNNRKYHQVNWSGILAFCLHLRVSSIVWPTTPPSCISRPLLSVCRHSIWWLMVHRYPVPLPSLLSPLWETNKWRLTATSSWFSVNISIQEGKTDSTLCETILFALVVYSFYAFWEKVGARLAKCWEKKSSTDATFAPCSFVITYHIFSYMSNTAT